MRKHRLQQEVYEVKFDNKIYKHTYKRNFYGFRGDDVDPKDQKIIFIGVVPETKDTLLKK